uniref:Uncharacterized protein n=1 Tax=Glossina palpalis gambiensis TaxID=67801 RepID=A0A1B0BYD4_9MUSC
MEDDIILCKIAEEQCVNIEEKDLAKCVKYKERMWRLTDSLQTHANELQEILNLSQFSSVASTVSFKNIDFGFVESWLVVIYREGYQRNKAIHEIIENLARGINGRLNENPGGSEKVLKTYVTTQLFEALKKAHLILETNNQETLKLPAKFLPSLCKY